jgi:hypothetical protein
MTKRLFLVVAALLGLLGEAAAGEFGGVREFYPYFSVQDFTWEEFSGGQRLLKEDGLLYAAGAAAKVDLLQTGVGSLTLRGKGELFGGVVGYNGQTQKSPDPMQSELPVKTDVTYFGTKEELALGWTVPLPAASLLPFAGVGHRWWLRDLHNSRTIDGTATTVQVQGYTEYWQTVYAKLGLAADYRLTDDWQLFAEAGGKYPFYNSNRINVGGVGDVTLKPESLWSTFAELGFRYKRIRPALFYEGYRTGQSPAVPIAQNLAILQPKSHEDLIGFSLGWCFK